MVSAVVDSGFYGQWIGDCFVVVDVEHRCVLGHGRQVYLVECFVAFGCHELSPPFHGYGVVHFPAFVRSYQTVETAQTRKFVGHA